MDFVPKSNFLWSLYFTEFMSEKMVFSYFGKKTIIFRAKTWSFNKGQKCRFFKGVSPWIYSKNRNFSYGFFLQKLSEKNRF